MRTALLALRTVRDEYLLVGDVAVTRSPRDLEGGYTWHVAFTQENPGAYASLVALGTFLQPQSVGAAVSATLVRSGGQHAVLSLVVMESVGVVSQVGQSLSVRWLTGTTARGDVATGVSGPLVCECVCVLVRSCLHALWASASRLLFPACAGAAPPPPGAQMGRLRAALVRASFVAASAASLSCWTPLAAPPTSPP